ncbi:MAG TPA: cyclase family protein [Solirubrobacteraceae bacterium]|nr:cyclase family protein [Solirubrobacteraceae bacterium]
MKLPLDPCGVRVYDLSQPLEQATPTSPNHPGFQIALMRRHGDVVRADGSSGANDLMTLGTHTGTHIDALCHIANRGILHGGADAATALRGGRFAELGAETIAPIVARGVLLDVGGQLTPDGVLDPGKRIDRPELEEACRRAGVEPRAGDVVLVRTGWTRHLADPEAFLGRRTGVPGVDESGARWLAGRRVRAVGADTMSFEHIVPGPNPLLPVHTILLVEHGIHIIEMLNLDELAQDGVAEFLLIAAPLRIVGATGAPIRPLGIVNVHAR